jgi:hypothetical protein
MALKVKTMATDGWLHPNGDFYPCRLNMPHEDAWTLYATNGHQASAQYIIQHLYGENPDGITDELGLSQCQQWLRKKGWIRVDIESVWASDVVTKPQVETLRQMLAMKDFADGFCRHEAKEIVEQFEREQS